VHLRLVSAVKRIEFVCDRLSYIVLKVHWLHIIVVNVNAPSEEKSEEVKVIMRSYRRCSISSQNIT